MTPVEATSKHIVVRNCFIDMKNQNMDRNMEINSTRFLNIRQIFGALSSLKIITQLSLKFFFSFCSN